MYNKCSCNISLYLLKSFKIQLKSLFYEDYLIVRYYILHVYLAIKYCTLFGVQILIT
jgi:hypothetical protein